MNTLATWKKWYAWIPVRVYISADNKIIENGKLVWLKDILVAEAIIDSKWLRYYKFSPTKELLPATNTSK